MTDPIPQETVINLRPASSGAELAPRPVTAGRVALATGAGVLALAVLGGAAVALFNVALTTVTILAFAVALLAVLVLLPALMMALDAGRIRARETVARAMPLETLILQRKQFEGLITAKGRQLAEAKGNVASALQQANLSAEDRHVTESALSEIARRAGRNAALLDEALAAGEQQGRARGAGA